MTKTKTKFRFRVLVAVEMTIIMVAILLNLYLEWYVPQNTLDYALCGLESVECLGEWDDFQEKMAEIAKFKQSRAYVIEVISEVARQEGIDKDIMIAVHDCETAHTTDLYNENDPYGGANGYYQIIYKWHPSVTPECAYDPWCSARYFAKRYKQGDAGLWSCYNLVISGEYND